MIDGISVLRMVLLACLPVIGGAATPTDPPQRTFVAQPDCASLSAGAVQYFPDGTLPSSYGPANRLTAEEAAQGWRLLFDGESLKGWRGFQRPDLPQAWRIKGDALMLPGTHPYDRSEARGDIRTEGEFCNFELRLQWATVPGGNSGIFFLVAEGVADRIWHVAPEMQILDDAGSEDGIELAHRAGGLYGLYAPACNALRPVGEFNDVRLVVRDGLVEHWLNGFLIVTYEIGSDDWYRRVAASKFARYDQFAKGSCGYLALQDHRDEIRFRNMRIIEYDSLDSPSGYE